MENLKSIICKNLVKLRKQNKLTQLELAEKINYNEKTLSKWETGETLPSIEVLKALADFYHISVDDILNHDLKTEQVAERKKHRYSRLMISLLGIFTVWLIAILVFVALVVYKIEGPSWMSFIYAIPVSAICGIVFNTLWGYRKMNYPIISVLAWSTILAIYLSMLLFSNINAWPLFFVGIPAQIIIILWSRLKKR